MMQPDLYTGPPPPRLRLSRETRFTLRDRVAALFRSRPHEWLDMHELARVGGCGGWRTRVSDCRTELGMTIENRVRRVPATAQTKAYTIWFGFALRRASGPRS